MSHGVSIARGENEKNYPSGPGRGQRYVFDAVQISGAKVFTSNVRLLDLSVSEVSVEVDKRLNLGADYSIKLENKGVALSLRGKVIWSNLFRTEDNGRGDMVPIYRTGLRFSPFSSQQAGELARFIGECSGSPKV